MDIEVTLVAPTPCKEARRDATAVASAAAALCATVVVAQSS